VKGILGESSQHLLAAELQPWMGLCQGNGTAWGSELSPALPADAVML